MYILRIFITYNIYLYTNSPRCHLNYLLRGAILPLTNDALRSPIATVVMARTYYHPVVYVDTLHRGVS